MSLLNQKGRAEVAAGARDEAASARAMTTAQYCIEPLEGRVLFAVPSGFAQSSFASGLTTPTAMAFAPDGRLFVTEQGGAVRVVSPGGQLLPAPFATVPARNVDEQGLLCVTFDPAYAENRYVYIHWITQDRANRVSRFTADAANPNVAAAGSEVTIFEGPPNGGNNHNGGALHFGPGGKLFLTLGERGDSTQSQPLTNPFGKVLRINPDGTIPTDNPFYGQTTGVNRAIWALGLRNPFTMAVQPGTGRIFINDVGWGDYEEVNEGAAGRNFGWPTTEGPFNAGSYPQFTNPVFANVSDWPTRSIAGGTFYNPQTPTFPASYVGDYFVGDYVGGLIQHVDLSGASPQVSIFATEASVPRHVDLDVGPDGSLYALARGNESAGGGFVAKIAYNASGAPVVGAHPQSQTVAPGQPVTFTVSATGNGTLSYQWQRNGTDIPGATSASYTLASPQPSDNGAAFRCVVSNSSGTAVSNAATLTVTSNQPPTATITAPSAGSLYSGGQTITFGGSGSDPEDGALGAAALTWRVDLHHDTHTHPALAEFSGAAGGSYTVPTIGETSANVWYRIHLRVTDSEGLTHSTFRDVHPRTARLTIATSPPGLSLNLDGSPPPTPLSFDGVVNITRSLGAPLTQTAGGVTYQFVSWSDDGARDHNISTPSADTTYTATYRVVDTSAPSITSHPQSVGVSAGQPATFSVTAGGAPPLSYQWQRDGVDIPGATSATYTLPSVQLSDSGATFRCVVGNANGSATSNTATLTVATGQAPAASITTPAEGALFRGGDVVTFSGTATDAEDGALPAGAFTWEVVLHRDGQSTAVVAPFGGATGGSFAVPTTADTVPGQFYRIRLHVTDSDGLTHDVTRDLHPRTAAVTLASNPPGAQLTLDGQPVTAGHIFVGVAGVTRTIGAPASQTVDGVVYDFVSWSGGDHGGHDTMAGDHPVVTPDADTTMTATYQPRLAPDPRYDLTATVGGRLPAQVIGGKRGAAVVLVRNGGAELLVGLVTVKVFMSSDGVWDAGDAEAGTVTRRLALRPGVTRPVRLRVVYPALPDGNYRLLAHVDPDNAVGEADEANNVSASAAPIANQAPVIDLSGSMLLAPTTLVRGRRSSVALSLLNGGNIPATGALTLTLGASVQADGAGNVVTLSSLPRPLKLRGGGRKTVRIAFIPPAELQPGTYYFSVRIDSASTFTETNEANNVVVSQGTFTIA